MSDGAADYFGTKTEYSALEMRPNFLRAVYADFSLYPKAENSVVSE